MRGRGSSHGNAAGLQHLSERNGSKLGGIDDSQADVGRRASRRKRAEEANLMRAEGTIQS